MRPETGRWCAGAALRVRQRAGGTYVTHSHWPVDLLPPLLCEETDDSPTHDAALCGNLRLLSSGTHRSSTSTLWPFPWITRCDNAMV